MNTESPLIPQGSFLEQKNKGRARVKVAVFVVLAIHGVGVMALLMQGCNPAQETPATNIATNEPVAVAPAFIEPTNIVAAPVTNPPIVEVAPLVQSTSSVVTAQESVPTIAMAPSTVTEHKIVRGDTLDKLAKHYGVSRKAIEDANPGIEPTRLKVGRAVQIPAAAPATLTAAAPTGAASEATASGQTYKVKSGDNLLKVAKQHGVTVKAIRSANNMKTDRIRVGQTLKIPAKGGNGGASSEASTSAPAAGTL